MIGSILTVVRLVKVSLESEECLLMKKFVDKHISRKHLLQSLNVNHKFDFFCRMAPEVILAMDEGQYDGKV